MNQLPVLATKETARLREEYPSIEHLEAGNIASWLVERKNQLQERAKDERVGMNLAKLVTITGTAIGTIGYATSPLAPIGALVAAVGYVWAVAQDLNDSHQFAPLPFIRGNFIEFLQAMGDSEARDEWFANSSVTKDLMFHLEPSQRQEFVMLQAFTHILVDYLSGVDAGKRFYAYRWLLDCFGNFKGIFPTTEEMNKHLGKVTLDPRVNYQSVDAIAKFTATITQLAPKTQLLAAPSTQPLPQTVSAPILEKSAAVSDYTAMGAVDTHVSNHTAPSQQEFDIIGRMVQDLTSQLIVAVPGTGKGILISNAIDAIKKLYPEIKIFYIDPKGDDKELGYFKGRVDVLKRAKIMDMPPVQAVKWTRECIEEFQKIDGPKLLVLDEGTVVTSKFKNVKGALTWLKDKIVSYCSCGDSAGLRVWVVVQNPHTDDLGINGGLRSQLVPIAIVNPKNTAAYGALIATTLIPSDKKLDSSAIMEIAAKSPVKRAIYHGGINEWMPMPELENFSGYNRDTRQYIAGTPIVTNVEEPKNTTASIQLPSQDSLNSVERQELRTRQVQIEPRNQTELVLMMLEQTNLTSLNAFVEQELKLSDEKKTKTLQNIITTIQSTEREDLARKFNLEWKN